MHLERSILTIKIWDTFTQSRAQAETGRRNAVEGSRAHRAGTQSPALQPAARAGQKAALHQGWRDPHQHLPVQPLHLLIKFCRYWAMVQQHVCPQTTPHPPALPPAAAAQPRSGHRASGRGDIVPSWRGTASACEPAHFIHCTSTFPTGIISIKPSALPSSPGLHPLGCLRYCSICEPAQADATSLSQSAKKTIRDSDRTDAPGGFDALPEPGYQEYLCQCLFWKAHGSPWEFKPFPFHHGKTPCPRLPEEEGWEQSRGFSLNASLGAEQKHCLPGHEHSLDQTLRMAADPQDLISYLSALSICFLETGTIISHSHMTSTERQGSVTMKDLKLKSAAPSPWPPQHSPVEATESMIKQLQWSVNSALRERDPVLSIARDSQGTWESLQLLRTWQGGNRSEAKIESHRSALTVITACLKQGRWAAQHTSFLEKNLSCRVLPSQEWNSTARLTPSNLPSLLWSQKGGKY